MLGLFSFSFPGVKRRKKRVRKNRFFGMKTGKIGSLLSKKSEKILSFRVKNRLTFYNETPGFIRVFLFGLFSFSFLIKRKEKERKEKNIYKKEKREEKSSHPRKIGNYCSSLVKSEPIFNDFPCIFRRFSDAFMGIKNGFSVFSPIFGTPWSSRLTPSWQGDAPLRVLIYL